MMPQNASPVPVAEGALISYGPDTLDIVRRSASYVDRTLKGEKPTRTGGNQHVTVKHIHQQVNVTEGGTGKPCQGAAMPNGRCKLHGGKSTGPRTPEGLKRSRRANWKHGHFSREAKAERSRLRAALLALRDLCDSI